MATDRKHLSKKDAVKLKPGTFVRIMWDDAPDEVVMLLEKPERDYGGLCYLRDNGERDTHADYRRIVSVVGKVEWGSEYEPESEHRSEIFNAYVHVKNEYDEATTLALAGVSP